jgi:divalent metal cation (Fe/Co/Zn/Cd) transporter
LTIHEVWAHRRDQKLYLEMHVGVDPQFTLGQAHERVDRLEQLVVERLPQVAGVHTHIELATTQVVADDPQPSELELRVREVVDESVAGFPALSRPHNLWLRRNPADGDKIYLFLECAIAPETPVVEAHRLASRLELELSRRLEEVAEVSVHLEPPDQD